MRIVFEECLPFVRGGKAPFGPMKTFALTDRGEQALALPSRVKPFAEVAHLFNERYVVAWGVGPTYRFCHLQSRWDATEPMLLGVRKNGFLDRVTGKARANGIPLGDVGTEFSPLHTSSWFEREGGAADGVSFTVMPTGANADESILDAGLIVMGGPANPKQSR